MNLGAVVSYLSHQDLYAQGIAGYVILASNEKTLLVDERLHDHLWRRTVPEMIRLEIPNLEQGVVAEFIPVGDIPGGDIDQLHDVLCEAEVEPIWIPGNVTVGKWIKIPLEQYFKEAVSH